MPLTCHAFGNQAPESIRYYGLASVAFTYRASGSQASGCSRKAMIGGAISDDGSKNRSGPDVNGLMHAMEKTS